MLVLLVPRIPCCLLRYDSRLCVSIIQGTIWVDINVDIPGLQFVWLSSCLGILKLVLELDIFLVVASDLLLMHLAQFLRDH
jgi:hypothetical protein